MNCWEKLDTVMSLIRSADAVPEKDRPGVYKAAKAILKEVEDQLDTMITVANVVADEEDE